MKPANNHPTENLPDFENPQEQRFYENIAGLPLPFDWIGFEKKWYQTGIIYHKTYGKWQKTRRDTRISG